MKKLIFTGALLTVASMVSFAQTQTAPTSNVNPNGGQSNAQARPMPITAEQRAEHMTKRDEMMFTLTPEQRKSVYDVELDFAKTIEKYRAEGKQPTPEDRENIMSKKDAKMKEILTPEQYAKYDVTRNRQHNGQMAPPNQPVPAPQQQKQ